MIQNLLTKRIVWMTVLGMLVVSSVPSVIWAEDAELAAKADALIKESDCLTCHTVDTKILGPSYREVSQKYKGDASAVDTLVEKIIEGGQGNWGPLPMTPHDDLSQEDAEVMVRWILSIE